jgi:hypothetical protein
MIANPNVVYEIPGEFEPVLNELDLLFGDELDFVVVSLPNVYEIKAWRRIVIEGENLWAETWDSLRIAEPDHLMQQKEVLIRKLLDAGFSKMSAA